MNFVAPSLSSMAPASWASLSGFTSGGVTKVRSLSGLNAVNGVLGPLLEPKGALTVSDVEPKGALTVSDVMSNARGVVMVRCERRIRWW